MKIDQSYQLITSNGIVVNKTKKSANANDDK